MFRKVIKLAGIGFVFGMIMGNLIAWFSGGCVSGIVGPRLLDMAGSEAAAIVIQTLFSGLLGAIAMAGTIVYDEENWHWPLFVSTLVHCLAIIVSYALISLWLGWVGSAEELFIVMGIQVVCFAVIWIIMYLRGKAQVRELNELLKKSRDGKEEKETNKKNTEAQP